MAAFDPINPIHLTLEQIAESLALEHSGSDSMPNTAATEPLIAELRRRQAVMETVYRRCSALVEHGHGPAKKLAAELLEMIDIDGAKSP